MAPKEPFKVHSLSKHIENTKKGLSTEAQYNRRPANRAANVKKEAVSKDPNNLFTNNDEEEEASSDSDSSSDEGGSDFLRKLVAPDAKSTSAAARRRSKEDEIADSDDERNASKKRPSTGKKSDAAKPEPASSSDTSSESESDDEAKVKTNGTTPAKASDTSSSTSDSESESEDEEPAKTVQVPANDKDSSESSSEDETSEDESEAEPDTKAKPTVNGTAASAAAAESTSSSEDGESEGEDNDKASKAVKSAKPAKKSVAPESDSSSSSEAEDSDDEMVDESMHIVDRQVAVPNFIAPDFVLRKGDDGANGRDVADVCNQANLEGKQFWYFTVPSNVPISVVQNLEIPMNQSKSDDKLFSHDGEDYGVSFDSIAPKGNIQILIPSSDGSEYRSAPRQIDQVMQVKKITQLGTTLPDGVVGPAPKRSPRPQPAGLKARYQPIGVNEPMGKIGVDETADKDVEMAEAPAVSTKTLKKEKKRNIKDTPVQVSPDASATVKDKKQKKRGEGTMEPTSSRTVAATPDVTRKGKRKHTASEDDAFAVTEQLEEETKSAVSKTKKQKTNRSGSPDLGSEPASVNAAKQTPILPPAIPTNHSAATPTPKATSSPAPGTSKKSKKSKEPKSEALVASIEKAGTPVPAPRQTAVPIPAIPHSSPLKPSPVPTSQPTAASPSVTKEEKRAKKRKEKENKKTPGSKKVTPVPPPRMVSSSD
ncbi:hypothetical protein FZEAL_4736 [Fusarium zealandicum]|uniref:DNA-directed RNA polymerase I subunit n=1 Tax=Fusarium zealandicum TaxID=1053134 RepID=A0A8H4UL79_9HYPO|nr:hypothetical protein FZEAL_4736 [Fusarium zealandicum]